MSALFSTSRDESVDANQHEGDTIVAGTPLVVRRRAALAALIGAGASAVAIAYLWRASQTMTVMDWSLCVVMALVAGYYLTTLVDARTPLAIADDLGVRIRLGDEWRGLPWEAVREVAIHPRRGLLRDGRIVISPHSVTRAVEGLEGKPKRHAAMNQKMYGAALAVPVGVMTRVSTNGERNVVEAIAALSLGRAEVVEIAPAPPTQEKRARTREKSKRSTEPAKPAKPAEPAPPEPTATIAVQPVEIAGEPAAAAEAASGRRRIFGGIATIVSRAGKSHPSEPASEPASEVGDAPVEPVEPVAPVAPVEPVASAGGTAPLRTTHRALRAEVTRATPATQGNSALQEAHQRNDMPGPMPESPNESSSPDSGARVRLISEPGDPVEPLVVDDFVTEPAYDPVIGPELTAARTRLGLSVDELADRTRIRPHVIESIEVDDFDPCGGDFYARGHLRTLARVLGKDPAPLLEALEERYATAPINARRVFEAELATGMRGSMRSTAAGPNWGLLIGVVLCLILVWGVIRFFSAEPAELVQNPAPVLNGSAGLGTDPRPGAPGPGSSAASAEPLPVTLDAAYGGSRVVVRNGSGRIIFSGELAAGELERVVVAPPVRVFATDAGAIEVSVDGNEKRVLGVLGASGNHTFRQTQSRP